MPQLHDASGTPQLRAATTRRVLSLAAISAAVLLVSACGKADGQSAGAGGPKPPPVEVGVVTATPGDVGLITELPGRVEASRVAQVRARAAGILQQLSLIHI